MPLPHHLRQKACDSAPVSFAARSDGTTLAALPFLYAWASLRTLGTAGTLKKPVALAVRYDFVMWCQRTLLRPAKRRQLPAPRRRELGVHRTQCCRQIVPTQYYIPAAIRPALRYRRHGDPENSSHTCAPTAAARTVGMTSPAPGRQGHRRGKTPARKFDARASRRRARHAALDGLHLMGTTVDDTTHVILPQADIPDGSA